MEKLGHRIEDRTMNSMLRKICRESGSDPDLSEELARILRSARQAGRRISPYTRSAILGAFIRGGRTKDAIFELREIERRGDLILARWMMEKTASEMNRTGRVADARSGSLQQKPRRAVKWIRC